VKTILYSITCWLLLCQSILVKANDLPPFPCDSLETVDPSNYIYEIDTTYENCLLQAIETESTGYKKDPYQYLNNLISFQLNKGEYNAALETNEKLIKTALNLEDSITAFSSKIYIYTTITQELGKAKETVFRALDVAKQQNSKNALASVYFDSSIISTYLSDTLQAIKDIDLAYELLPYVKNQNTIARILYEKAKILDIFGNSFQKKEIPQLLKESKILFQNLDEVFNVIVCNSLLAYHYGNNDEFENYPEAERLFLSDLNLVRTDIKDTKTEVEILLGLANIYNNQNKYKEASKYYKEALPLALKIENYYKYSHAALFLSKALEKQGKHQESLKYYKDYKAAEDTITQREERDVLYDLEAKYKNKEQAQSLELLAQENTINQQQRNIFLGIAMGLLGLAGLLFFNLRQKNRLNKIISEQFEQVKELNIFKNQLFAIIGHDLRGLLSKLNFSQLKFTKALHQNKTDKLEALNLQTGTQVEKLNGLVENLLYWGMQQSESISINKELVLLQQIAQQVVYNVQNDLAQKEIDIELNIPDQFDIETDIDILKLSLRNLLSNAIKFSNQGSKIEIIAEEKEDQNIIQVKDYGIGIPSEKIASIFEVDANKIRKGTSGERGTGLGLWICKEMLQKIGASIHVDSILNKETLFTLKFPKLTLHE